MIEQSALLSTVMSDDMFLCYWLYDRVQTQIHSIRHGDSTVKLAKSSS